MQDPFFIFRMLLGGGSTIQRQLLVNSYILKKELRWQYLKCQYIHILSLIHLNSVLRTCLTENSGTWTCLPVSFSSPQRAFLIFQLVPCFVLKALSSVFISYSPCVRTGWSHFVGSNNLQIIGYSFISAITKYVFVINKA